jgi:hypothetical protein
LEEIKEVSELKGDGSPQRPMSSKLKVYENQRA